MFEKSRLVAFKTFGRHRCSTIEFSRPMAALFDKRSVKGKIFCLRDREGAFVVLSPVALRRIEKAKSIHDRDWSARAGKRACALLSPVHETTAREGEALSLTSGT